MGPASFSSYFFLSPFLGFLPSLIFAPRASNHFFAQGKLISIAVVSFFLFSFFFLVCDLMVNSAVVVWVMDLAVWIWPTWASALRVDRRGLSAKSSEWSLIGGSLIAWVSLEGCFSFSFSDCWWWWGCGFVIWLWFWRVVFLFLFLVAGGEWWGGCGFGFVIWLWFWWLVVMVVGGGDSGSCCSCGGAWGWFYLFLFSMVVADSYWPWVWVCKEREREREKETENKKNNI